MNMTGQKRWYGEVVRISFEGTSRRANILMSVQIRIIEKIPQGICLIFSFLRGPSEMRLMPVVEMLALRQKNERKGNATVKTMITGEGHMVRNQVMMP
jgi:hypothetical protein